MATYLELPALKECSHVLVELGTQLPMVIRERASMCEDELLLLARVLLGSQVLSARASDECPARRNELESRTLDRRVGHAIEDDAQRRAYWVYNGVHGGDERLAGEVSVEDVRRTKRFEQLGVLERGGGDDVREAGDARKLNRWG